MTPDEPEVSLERLFRAARSNQPHAGVRTRAVARALASSRERSRGRGLAFGVVLAAAACVAVTLGFRHFHADRVSVGPETLTPNAHPNPTPDLPPPPRSPAPAAVTPNADASASATHLEKVPVPRPAPTLGEELALLQAARAALDAGDGKHALALLDHYARSSRTPRLGDEATIVRLEALSRTGRGADAAALARDFVSTHPGSPLVDRARGFMPTPKTSSSSTEPEGLP